MMLLLEERTIADQSAGGTPALRGEVAVEAIEPGVEVIAQAAPFQFRRRVRTVDAGGTIFEILEQCGVEEGRLQKREGRKEDHGRDAHATDRITGETPVPLIDHGRDARATYRVWLYSADRREGCEVPAAYWHCVRPKPGSEVVVKAVPGATGGGNGSGQAIIGVILIVVGFFFAPWLVVVGMQVLSSGIQKMLTPKPKQNMSQLGGNRPQVNQTAIGLGVQNQSAPWNVVPNHLGKCTCVPYLAAPQYHDVVGDELYVHFALLVGYGPRAIDDVRFGDTPASELLTPAMGAGATYDPYLAGATSDLQLEIRNGFPNEPEPTLYPGDMGEAVIDTDFEAGVPVVRQTATGTTRITVIITCKRGIGKIDAKGDIKKRGCDHLIEYRKAGDVDWITAGNVNILEAKLTTLSRYLSWDVAAGQYDVQATRSTAVATDSDVINGSSWTFLKSMQKGAPIALKDRDDKPCYAGIFGFMKASLGGGLVNQISCMTTKIARDFGAWELGLDGASGKIVGSYHMMRAGSFDRTYELEIKTTALSGGIFQAGSSAGADGGDFSCLLLDPATHTTFNFRMALKGAGNFDLNLPNLQDGNWHQLAVTYGQTSGHVRVYIDGVLEADNARTIGTARTRAIPFTIGCWDGTSFGAIAVKDVRIWTNELDGATIAAHADLAGDESGLIAWFPLDEGSGTTVYNRAGGRGDGPLKVEGQFVRETVHATLSGGASWSDVSGSVTPSWALRPTRNPASAWLEVLQGNATETPQDDADLDMDTIEAWHTWCKANGYHCDLLVDADQSGGVRGILEDVTAAGRASLTFVDNLLSIAQDIPKATLKPAITPRNTLPGFRWTNTFEDIPHCWKVRFKNEDTRGQDDLMFVFRDGYNWDGSAGKTKATKFSELDIKTESDPDAVYKMARFHIAQLLLRPEKFIVQMDWAHFIYFKGDRVPFAYDVILVGGRFYPRIKRFILDGSGNLVQFELDDIVQMETAKTYRLRVTGSAGVATMVNIDTDPGDQTTVTLSTPVAAAAISALDYAEKDQALFGETDLEWMEAIVGDSRPAADFGAEVELYPYLWDAITDPDTETIPPYDSMITLPAKALDRPPAPEVLSCVSDERAIVRRGDGSLETRVVITLKPLARGVAKTVDGVEVQYKLSGADPGAAWTDVPFTPVLGNQVSLAGLMDRNLYRIRLRYRASLSGVSGPWATIYGHYVQGVTGNIAPPPDADWMAALTNQNGTREIQWLARSRPIDFKGVEIRAIAGASSDWDAMTAIHDGAIAVSPFYTQQLASGTTYTLGIKCVDTSGNTSTNALFITFTPSIATGGVIVVSEAAIGWSGTKSDCYVEGLTGLHPATPAVQRGRRLIGGSPGSYPWTGISTWGDANNWGRFDGHTAARGGPYSRDLGSGSTPVVDYQASVSISGTDQSAITVSRWNWTTSAWELHSDADVLAVADYPSFQVKVDKFEVLDDVLITLRPA